MIEITGGFLAGVIASSSCPTPRENIVKACASIDFWAELDGDVLRCLDEAHGAVAPAELGRRLGMSEAAVCSILAMLATTGKVRIRSVERA